MQTIGEEQTFQTLFRELRKNDESLAPRFSVVWNRAQDGTRPRLSFKHSFGMAAVLVVSILSFALWLMVRPSAHQQGYAVEVQAVTHNASLAPLELNPTPGQLAMERARYRINERKRQFRLTERRRAKMSAFMELQLRNAILVSSWKSPTATLMQVPANEFLTSLPQMYRSVYELNEFLLEKQE